MDKLKLVKLIVCILTFLLIFGLLSAAGIVYKQIKKSPQPGDIALNQPAGSYIADYRINENTVYILIKGGQTADRLAVINPNTAKPLLIKIN